ncbi:hypothetical protein [Luteibacter yeojuensis]|uniref:Type 1 fimbrial protein n=1 Tax=Luteibacter yeojuensis TaxID=345309 RepID=A0A0F3KDE9_9GAMM|nr:hypothetical protein [Luteibacter yeojuensis]KJV29275.1 hypothetical protein VI08_16150 [Luteibacter yeojuensis]
MRIATVLAPFAVAAAPAVASGGTLIFAGAIREPTCAVANTAAAPPCRQGVASTGREVPASRLAGVPLFDYAVARDPAVRWRVVEVVYR